MFDGNVDKIDATHWILAHSGEQRRFYILNRKELKKVIILAYGNYLKADHYKDTYGIKGDFGRIMIQEIYARDLMKRYGNRWNTLKLWTTK